LALNKLLFTFNKITSTENLEDLIAFTICHEIKNHKQVNAGLYNTGLAIQPGM